MSVLNFFFVIFCILFLIENPQNSICFSPYITWICVEVGFRKQNFILQRWFNSEANSIHAPCFPLPLPTMFKEIKAFTWSCLPVIIRPMCGRNWTNPCNKQNGCLDLLVIEISGKGADRSWEARLQSGVPLLHAWSGIRNFPLWTLAAPFVQSQRSYLLALGS